MIWWPGALTPRTSGSSSALAFASAIWLRRMSPPANWPTRRALRAIAAAGLQPADIDLIIVATSTPDYIFPEHGGSAAGAPRHHERRARPSTCRRCSGFGFAFALATAENSSVPAATSARWWWVPRSFRASLDWNDRGHLRAVRRRRRAVVWRPPDRPGILATALHADGSHNRSSGARAGQSRQGGRRSLPAWTARLSQVCGQGAVDVGREVPIEAGGIDDVDWLIPHQANIRIIQADGQSAGRAHREGDRHGGASMATRRRRRFHWRSIWPFVTADPAGQKILLEGVGGGFTWGAAPSSSDQSSHGH